jgi:MurNAc alpha-1-phosphate uridylyltransferase
MNDAPPPANAPPLRAIVLAAGRGERMRPLTDHTPKPLLPVHGKPMIEWHLEALARDGVRDLVVNTAWLEDQFEPALGNGSRFGVTLHYSPEGQRYGGALETAGGIATALPLLCPNDEPAFWVVSADIWAPEFRFDDALAERFIATDFEALLWLVPNPPFHPRGDFALGQPLPAVGPHACLGSPDGPRHTYANFALMRPRMLHGIPPGTRAALGPLLHAGIAAGRIAVQLYAGRWENVGTVGQWEALQVDSTVDGRRA